LSKYLFHYYNNYTEINAEKEETRRSGRRKREIPGCHFRTVLRQLFNSTLDLEYRPIVAGNGDGLAAIGNDGQIDVATVEMGGQLHGNGTDPNSIG
jgi:hypothetical protein